MLFIQFTLHGGFLLLKVFLGEWGPAEANCPGAEGAGDFPRGCGAVSYTHLPAEGEGKSNLFPVFKPDAFRYMKKGGGRRNLPFTVIAGINTDQKIFGGFISVMYCEGTFFYRTRFYGRSVFICCINIKERKMETGSIRPSV